MLPTLPPSSWPPAHNSQTAFQSHSLGPGPGPWDVQTVILILLLLLSWSCSYCYSSFCSSCSSSSWSSWCPPNLSPQFTQLSSSPTTAGPTPTVTKSRDRCSNMGQEQGPVLDPILKVSPTWWLDLPPPCPHSTPGPLRQNLTILLQALKNVFF